MKKKSVIPTNGSGTKNRKIVITGAGGFIGGALVQYFHDNGFAQISAVDKKPLAEWCQRIPGAERYFFSSSACAYNVELQKDPYARALKESDAYPAMAERGYGWEKLISEMFCQEYWAERSLKTYIARFHNVYGPHGTWEGGREKAPAAISRKVIEAKYGGLSEIDIWGDGSQTRSFMFIDDCVRGIDMIMHCDRLIATPINLGSHELISINDLVSMVEDIARVKLDRRYDLTAPRGVAGRNSDNTMIKSILRWEPGTPLREGMRKTYEWIEGQYRLRTARVRTESLSDPFQPATLPYSEVPEQDALTSAS